MRNLVTSVNESEYRKIMEFVEEVDTTVYMLLKTLLFDHIESELGQTVRAPMKKRVVVESNEITEILRHCDEQGIDLGAVLKEALVEAVERRNNPGKKV